MEKITMAASPATGATPVTWHTGRLGSDLTSDSVQSRPANPISEAPLASLVDISILRSLLDEFTVLTGIGTALLDPQGNILQGAGWQKACTDFHRAVPSSCANCTESDLFLASHLREGEFVDYKCKNGLWDVVTPVFVGKEHLGNLYCGQFFYDDDVVDESFFVAQAERYGFDRKAYLAAIRRIPRYTREHVRRIMTFMVSLASYLSNLSLTNLQLRESRSQMETLINALPDPVWLKDSEGVFLGCNRAFERMLGASAAEIIGKSDHDFCPPEQADFFREKDREAMRASEPRVNEASVVSAESGQPVHLETIKTALPGPNGEPIGVLSIARDITARKAAEVEIQRLNTELEQRVAERTAELLAANRELEAFSFAASHDLRAPLQRINSFSTLLERNFRDRLEGDGLLFLDLIRQNAIRLTRLVEELLGHARVAQKTLELQNVDIPAAMQSVLREKADEIENYGAEVRVNLPAAEILADTQALHQVLANMVENALKYSSRVASPLVEIGGEPADGRFRLWVRDNGIGFDMVYHDKIFEIFRRLHTHQEYSGSGVGLALVKRAMERMDGRVWAESQPGQGATFFLELQMAK